MAWTPFPHHDDAYVYTAAGLKAAWARLHAGDAEPYPKKAALVEAWIAFHAGDFERARKLGLDMGITGYAVAHKASCIYASYLEPNDKKKLAMFEEVAERCERQQAEQPDNPAGHYWHAYALGRYAQRISIVKALAQGLAPKVRASLAKAITLAPAHADAQVALGAYHAEIVGSVGAMIAGLTYGARKEESHAAFKRAIALHPASVIARVEYGDALLVLDPKKNGAAARELYREAAALTPLDAAERLDVESARTKAGAA